MAADVLQERKTKVLTFLRTKKTWLIYLVLAFITIFSYRVRTSNLTNLKDMVTGQYIPLALDPFVFLRYARELLANGNLAAVDMLRYFPDGYTQIGEFSLLTHYVVGLFKVFSIFNSSLTLEYVHVIYPPLTFSLTLIFFFLLVRKLFDYRVGLLATAYLAVIPILLYRTIAGFSDKESLALFLFVLAFYFYVTAWMNPHRTKSIVFGLLAGLVTGLMGLTWGGVQFTLLILGLFALIEIAFGKFSNNDFYTYASWSITAFIVINLFSARYTLSSYLSPTFGIAYLALGAGLLDYIIRNRNPLNLKSKLHGKLPLGIFSVLVMVLLSPFVVIFSRGPGFIIKIVNDQIAVLTTPFASSRWGVTVAESHQPYLSEVISQLGKFYFFLFIVGSIFLFYTMVKHIQRHKYKLTAFYTLFILAFLFSRYSRSGTLDGANTLSLILYFGSLAIFFIGLFAFYFYAYKKDPDTYKHILNMNKAYTLVIIWFIIKIIAARSAVRLVLLLAFITAILAAYLMITFFDFAMQKKKWFVKYPLLILLAFFTLYPGVNGTLANYTEGTISVARNVGVSYSEQWQVAMDWVKKNTPEDAVFMHWWDYGYWVQTGGERATVSDGGNVGGAAVNYFTARNVLTSPNEEDALAFMKAKGATHFLTLSDDVGKYPAYSSIGSDLENDRYSWISTYHLDLSKTQETRDNTMYVYGGGATALDADFVYEDTLFPERVAGIAGFFVPMTPGEQEGSYVVSRPLAVVVHNNQQHNIPLNCIVSGGQRAEFGTDGLDGCLLIIPSVTGNEMDSRGAALYLSAKVKDSMFARLYLYGEETEHFKLVYSDDDQIPLAVYNGRFFGPLKIWEATIPEDIEVDPTLLEKGLPDPRLYYAV